MNFLRNMFTKNNVKDLEFVDTTRMAYMHNPVQKASEVIPHFKKRQVEKYKKFEFIACPGMVDLKNYGYIIPAWDDMHFIANESDCMALIGGTGGKRQSPFAKPKLMSTSIAEGILENQDNVPLKVFHFGSPWRLSCQNKEISALIQAATFHSSFLHNLNVYPGIVDYGKFSTINLICSIKRKCEFTIKAGEPLLHVIPFHGKGISAGFGPGDQHQIDEATGTKSSTAQWYRKYITRKKETNLTSQESEKEV